MGGRVFESWRWGYRGGGGVNNKLVQPEGFSADFGGGILVGWFSKKNWGFWTVESDPTPCDHKMKTWFRRKMSNAWRFATQVLPHTLSSTWGLPHGCV